MLALVLMVAFALSTFHVHSHGSGTPDAAVATVVALDDAAHGGDKSPDVPDRHAAADCPICALLTHVLAASPIEAHAPRTAGRERFVLGRETRRAPPLFEHHRPPIAPAV